MCDNSLSSFTERAELASSRQTNTERYWIMNIREFPLAWRWTDPRHAQFSEDLLSKLAPVEPREAERLYEQSRRSLEGDNLSSSLFPRITRHDAAIESDMRRDWLRTCWRAVDDQVVVSWSTELALRTTWEIFTAHWDNFCYPALDDVLVWPESETWALLYTHDEQFQFGLST
jgi:hypothetical protein